MQILSWDEPRAYRRSQNLRHRKPIGGETLKTFLIVVAGLLVLRAMVALNPRPGNQPIAWGPMVGLALGVGFLASFLFPWIISVLGFARVLISEKGVNHNSLSGLGWRIDHHPWNTIKSGSIILDKDQRLLSIELTNGQNVNYAVASSISNDAIIAYFKSFNLNIN